jgi:cytochrome c-type biogenesis protein CcmH
VRGARWFPWMVMAAVLAVALTIAAGDDGGGEPSAAQRVERLTSIVRCPTCRSLAASESDAPASNAIRSEVERRVRAGQTDGQILSYFVGRYGRDILLLPEGRGVAALVWGLPVAATLLAITGLVVAFRRWRAEEQGVPSSEDRRIVDEALDRR